MLHVRNRCLAAAAVVLLAACGQGDVATPPPLGHVAAPSHEGLADTRVLGAGPAACGVQAEEALALVNAARTAGRRCGARHMPAAAPLRWDARLQAAASGHSADMARRNYFEHDTPEGIDVKERVSARRYRWKTIGENLSGGNRTIGEAVEGWLASAPHCENLMSPDYTEVGVACVAQPGTQWGTYWTMVLARR